MAESIKASFRLDYGDFHFAVGLTLPGSGVTVLLGPSGCGKTTFLRCMAGLDRPPTGYFSVNGEIWQDNARNLFLPPHQRSLGYVFQDANLFPHLSVLENLHFGLRRVCKQALRNNKLESITELLAIHSLLNRMPDRLSGGEKQRVAIARALVLNPAILLMDEPLASLDEQRKEEVMPYLLNLQREVSVPIVYVTHSRQEATQLADYLVLLENGGVKAAGGVSETLGRLDLPLAREKQAVVVWQAVITDHEPEFKLTHAEFSGGKLSLPMIATPPGTGLRVQIHARDVSLAMNAHDMTSILNVIPATIIGMVDDQNGQTVIQLRVGQDTLLSHITCKSAQVLGLQVGMSVFAQIKGTSILF